MIILNLQSSSQVTAETVTTQNISEVPVARVLLVLSGDDTYDDNASYERAGVLDVMKRSSVQVDIEYLNEGQISSSSSQAAAWKQSLASKIDARAPYNAVLTAGDAALAFVEEYHDTVFSGIPVVFFGVRSVANANDAFARGYATGRACDTSVLDELKVFCTLRPRTSKILAISDATAAGVELKDLFKSASTQLPKYEFEVLDSSTMTHDELLQRVSTIGSDTIVVYLSAVEDNQGKVYLQSEAVHAITDACPQPVFSLSDCVGEGVVGSEFIDYEKAGKQAAETAIAILNGESPANIPVIVDSPDGWVFDAKALSKFGISQDSLPANAAVINNTAFTWQSVRPLLLPLLLLLAGFLLMGVFALMGYRRSVRDLSEIKKQSEELSYRLYHDPLTELPNRLAMMNFSLDSRSDKVKALVIVNLDDFKNVNDSYGHAVGDSVIQEYAERLRKLVATDMLAHLSGDEFIIGFEHVQSEDSRDIRALRSVLEEPVMIEGSPFEMTVSMGIVNRTSDMNADSMTRAADLAIRAAKEAPGKSATVLYDKGLREQMETNIAITRCLKQAIAGEDIVVLFQPQVDVETLDVHGYEALVRFRDNVYYPRQFIPVAEKAGLIVQLDRLVTKLVVKQLSTWNKRHKRMRPVSINYSPEQLDDEEYCSYLASLLEEYGVPSKYIRIEITESMHLEGGRAQKLFSELKSMGVMICVDDFGTGYSSMERLATMPADEVKLDKTLVDAILKPEKEQFARDLVEMIHGLGKFVVVEGVEEREQFDMCKRLECDVIQGYFFSKPIKPEEAVNFKPVVK